MYTATTDEEYLKSLTLLYVEDDELTREIYITFLSRLVGTLITANNGVEGVEIYNRLHPDIIMTDVQMPVMDGLAMAAKIRECDKHIPFIVLTAFDQGNYLIQSINIGIDKYVTKPAVGHQVQEALIACAHRLLVEEQLRYERLRLTYIIEGTKAGSWEWNVLSGGIIINERFAELFGYRLEELIPFSISGWRNFIHPDDLLKCNELLEKCFHGELEYFECDIRMRHKYGQWVWILVRGKVFSWTENGLPLSMYGSCTDLSLRKQMEDELRQSRDLITKERDRLSDALAHIKKLEGIIPICAYCKKIRDDKQSWNKLETYICEHSDATFSHGICPDCYEEQMKSIRGGQLDH